MMRGLTAVAWQTWTLLRRDQIVRAVAIGGFLLTGLAGLASTWTIEDRTKILFDVGFFGLQLLGSTVAIFWCCKMLGDSRQDGAIEWQLAAPLSRTSWLLGKYLGFALSLLLLAVLLLAIWQAGMLLLGFGMLTDAQVAVFLMMLLGWLVLGAMALMIAVVMRFALALFTAFGLWIAGLISGAVLAALGPETPEAAQTVVRGFARVWDLQHFNLIERVLEPRSIKVFEVADQISYGFLLIAIMLTCACLAMRQGDALAN